MRVRLEVVESGVRGVWSKRKRQRTHRAVWDWWIIWKEANNSDITRICFRDSRYVGYTLPPETGSKYWIITNFGHFMHKTAYINEVINLISQAGSVPHQWRFNICNREPKYYWQYHRVDDLRLISDYNNIVGSAVQGQEKWVQVAPIRNTKFLFS